MSAESETFKGVKNTLEKPQDLGAVKTDLFSHITEIINRILSTHKHEAYQKFEDISILIKKTQLKVKNPLPLKEMQNLKEDEAQEMLDRYVDEVRALLNNKLNLSPLDKKLANKVSN